MPEDFEPYTVEIAPSRKERIYASGRGPFPLFGVIARSDDGGGSWETSSFELKGTRGVYISAVDPANPDVLYARLDGDPGDTLRVSVKSSGSRELRSTSSMARSMALRSSRTLPGH